MSYPLHPSAWRAQSPVPSPFIPQTSLDFPPRQDDFEMFKSLQRWLHLQCVQRLQEVFFVVFFLTACFVKSSAFNMGERDTQREATFSSELQPQ